MTVTMIFGSFIAGSTSEGSAGVTFPVMTLLFHIHPEDARNFSLSIQSIGMTAASLWIIAKKKTIDKQYLFYALLGGLPGMLFSIYHLAPYMPPVYVKMFFVSFWLSFGIFLIYFNRIRHKKAVLQLPALTTYQRLELVFVAFTGGMFTAVLGTGVDVCTFAYLVMKYRLSEKVAIPTSVLLMDLHAITGFFTHQFLLKDIHPIVYHFWLVSIPVVMIGAPLGAWFASRAKRMHLADFISAIIFIQFAFAVIVIKPDFGLWIFSLASFLFGCVLFFLLTIKKDSRKMEMKEPVPDIFSREVID
ncbi:MAG: sulfite exporter TauE/SafE family protein [Acidobacterium ailaaui]|nr:sulfite exporter TauE/SafE family protein [Pseudacidobacterium ailaaui]